MVVLWYFERTLLQLKSHCESQCKEMSDFSFPTALVSFMRLAVVVLQRLKMAHKKIGEKRMAERRYAPRIKPLSPLFRTVPQMTEQLEGVVTFYTTE